VTPERSSAQTAANSTTLTVAPSLPPRRLLVAASGTGGHLFPALAIAARLATSGAATQSQDGTPWEIEWLGVRDRMETELVGDRYPLHYVPVSGLQGGIIGAVKAVIGLGISIWNCYRLLDRFDAVLTTGGYIAAPAILAARLRGLPTILHESNALPGKVTRACGRWCHTLAVGFAEAADRVEAPRILHVGTPVRAEFLSPIGLDLAIPDGVPVIAVMGGSQGAVAVNRMVRECLPRWFEAGAWVVHLTGENDPEAGSIEHEQYIEMPFYHNIAGLLQRSTLAISRAGAGAVTELSVSGTPAILIPFPFAAEDHQFYNGQIFVDAGAARMYRQADLSADQLAIEVIELLKHPETLAQMRQGMKSLAVTDSVDRLVSAIDAAITTSEAP
jgi:UDP-N-acetylglucosamine--N-acetylmuramyl-(pentapeptide) pyrophosphoryl-undecaprenol N-acetylglucosamine transferase